MPDAELDPPIRDCPCNPPHPDRQMDGGIRVQPVTKGSWSSSTRLGISSAGMPPAEMLCAHLESPPRHAGFMGSSKVCHSPCLTLQSRWCCISQTVLGAPSACVAVPAHSFFPGHSMQAVGLTHPAKGRASLLLSDLESSPHSMALARGCEVSVQACSTAQCASSWKS